MKQRIMDVIDRVEKLQKLTLGIRIDLPLNCQRSHEHMRSVESWLQHCIDYSKNALSALQVEDPKLIEAFSVPPVLEIASTTEIPF